MSEKGNFSAAIESACRAVLEGMEPRWLLAAELVADVNVDTADAAPAQFVQFADMVLFDALDGANGRQLWRTDGTPGGTSVVKQISAAPEILLMPPLSDVTLFFATDSAHGKELWRTDGTAAGTYLLKDINPGTASSPRPPNFAAAQPPDRAVVIDDVLYFQASDGVHGLELWRSDGTADGTYMVRDINAGSGGSGISHQVVVGDTIYFSAVNATSTSPHLWKSDGTAAGTLRVDPTGNAGLAARELTAVGDDVYFFAPRSGGVWELRRSDGSAAGTTLLASFSQQPAWPTALGDALFFVASDATAGVELWRSDATGTARVKDINPGTGFSSPTQLTAFNGEVYFAASDATAGRELWKSDGTDAGTVRVRDIRADLGSSLGTQAQFTIHGGALYFAADDGVSGTELWVTDGSEPGTTRVTEIVPGVTGGGISNMRSAGGALYFTGDDLLHGRELWRSDGTAGGTAMVKDLNARQDIGSTPSQLTRAGDHVYFLATRARTGAELWRSDGTPGGTHLVRDVRPGAVGQKSSSMLYVGDTLYFTADDGEHGTELWKTDGTEGGTIMVADVYPGATGGLSSGGLAAVGNTVYFMGRDDTSGYELWKSDGTQAGTARVKDITPGTGTSFVGEMLEFGGALYFAYGGSSARELWRTDGTDAGTVKVKQLDGPIGVENLEVVGDTLYFTGRTEAASEELWKTDGTDAGTVLVKDIYNGVASAAPRDLTAFKGRLFFWADGPAGEELWSSDGTDAGTTLVKDINPGPNDASGSKLTVGGNYLYFAVTEPTYGNELWLTDGTTAGTRLVKEIVPGTSLGAIVTPAQMAYANGLLYFAAGGYTPQGQELWQTDGTEAGTVVSADVAPGAGSSSPRNVIAVGDHVYFTASDGQRGVELWRAPAPPPAWLAAAPGAAYTFDGTTLTVTAGAVTIDADIATTSPQAHVVVRPDATVSFAATQHLASLTLDAGAAAAVSAGGDKFLRTGALNLAPGARLDMADNDLLLDYTGDTPLGVSNGATYTGVTGLLQSGYNGGAWDGVGVHTSMPDAATGLTTLAVAEAADILGISGGQTALWNGETIDGTTVIVKYTYGGDTNFDGKLDADDYGTIDFSVLVAGSFGYYAGDFNFDGKVDADDYGVIDFNILAQDGLL